MLLEFCWFDQLVLAFFDSDFKGSYVFSIRFGYLDISYLVEFYRSAAYFSLIQLLIALFLFCFDQMHLPTSYTDGGLKPWEINSIDIVTTSADLIAPCG